AIEGISQDVRGALRSAAVRPAATIAAVLTLALGLGSAFTAFSLVDRVALRPLDVPHPEQLVTVEGYRESQDKTTTLRSMSWESVSRVHEMTTVANAAIASAPRDHATENVTVPVAGRAPVRSARATFVSANYFRVLGIAPAVGRDFSRDDDVRGAARVAI